MVKAPPERPAHLPHGRWLGDLEAEQPLSEAEKALVACCARGEPWQPPRWHGKRPEQADTSVSNTIRADLIRFLAMGGDATHPVHDLGVMVGGGWIRGKIYLRHARLPVRLATPWNCSPSVA